MAPTAPAPEVPLAELGERVTLPSGGWIQLRHLDDLRSRHRTHITRAIPAGDMTPLGLIRMQYAVAEVMITGWQLPYLPDAPLPIDWQADDVRPSILEELTVRDENVLFTALEPCLDLINPSTVSVDDHANPDSPTEPAAA